MTPRDGSEPPPLKTDIFREQALQAWRGQDAEARVLLDLSPDWMRWALGSVLLLAALGTALAATTSIPRRATSAASARLTAGGDTILVDAVFALPEKATIRLGQAMSFGTQDPKAQPIDLTIVMVVPSRSDGTASTGSSSRVRVRGAIARSSLHGDARSFTDPEVHGTAHVLVGTETLLHLLRPRSPGGAAS